MAGPITISEFRNARSNALQSAKNLLDDFPYPVWVYAIPVNIKDFRCLFYKLSNRPALVVCNTL